MANSLLPCLIPEGYPLIKSNIAMAAMENGPFRDVLPIQNGNFPSLFVCLPESIPRHLVCFTTKILPRPKIGAPRRARGPKVSQDPPEKKVPRKMENLTHQNRESI